MTLRSIRVFPGREAKRFSNRSKKACLSISSFWVLTTVLPRISEERAVAKTIPTKSAIRRREMTSSSKVKAGWLDGRDLAADHLMADT